jgi:arabinofuranan 3-O-arabinosyltransferase
VIGPGQDTSPAGLLPYRALPRPPLRIGWPSQPDTPGRPVQLRDRWCFLGVFLISLLVFVSTDTGRMIFDTKLGVDINAAGFLTRLWQLWDPLEWFGTLQNQYIGYAVPMAPFFLLGQLAHLPVWLIERLWLATLITVGFAGLVKLARALGIGTDGTRLLAAAIFVLWPASTIVIGSTSAGAVPGLVLPWAVLPLVAAVQGGRPAGRSAALSGLAVTAMGGVNAVSTGYMLIAPALFILIYASGRLRVSLLAKWVAAVLAGTMWWLVPLLFQGQYSFNFLPYIEQSATTFATMSAAAFLRGVGNWTAYTNFGTPWLSAGWSVVTEPLAILASALAAATGLYGLARRDMPARRWLLASAGLAALVALLGYFGPLGDPLSGTADKLFDGVLAPLRSTYKLEPIAALALALGCAHAVSRWARGELPVRAGRVPAGAAIAPLAALVLAGLAVPQLSGQVLQPGSFSEVPGYWYQVAAYLSAHSPRQTALVVPADSHGLYLWGDPIDDPLEPLASSPWTERALVPFGGAGSQAFLTAAEQAVDSGQAVPGLPAYLARAGIRFVVVRNDLAPATIGYVSPQVANKTMALSGFERVASFGPLIASSPTYPQGLPATAGPAPSYPAVEVFQAANPAWRPATPVSGLPAASTVLVNGGPDSLLQLAGQGIVTTQPTVIAGDPLPVRPSLWAVTDGQRRADHDFGLPTQDFSFTYTATETNPPDSPFGAAGGPPKQLVPVPAAGHQTVAVLSGAAQVTASSYGSWLVEEPQYDPVNAFDGNPATAWAEGSATTPVGQWIQVTFDHPLDLPASIGIQMLHDIPVRPLATQVRVSTAAGAVTTDLSGASATQAVRVPPGTTGWLRITITGATASVAGGPGAGFTGVLIPGVTVTRYLEPAQDPAGTAAPSVTYSFEQQVASPSVAVGPQASEVLARTFQVPSAERVTVAGLAVPEAGAALDGLISSLTDSQVPAPGPGSSVQSACGQGPELRLDGRIYPTAVTATLADLERRLPVQVSVCTPGSELDLPPGQHWLEAAPSAAFVMTDLDMRAQPGTGAAHQPAASGGQRTVKVVSWQDDRRSLRIEPGAQAYVEIHENFNTGWVATLNGQPLTAIRLDGWQQAFIVPAGQGGLIKLRYTPATIYHGGLIAAGAALVMLAVVAIVPGRRRKERRASRRDKRLASRWDKRLASRRDVWGEQLLRLTGARQRGATVNLATSAASAPSAGRDRSRRRATRRLVVRMMMVYALPAVVIWLVGGPVMIAVPVLAHVGYRRPGWLPWVAFGAMLLTGVVSVSGHPATMGSGTFSGLAQACALVALAAALIPDTDRRAPRPADHQEDAQ